MSNLEEYSNKINEEVTAVLSRVDPEQMQTFLNLIQQARKIALYAGGREGLIIRALAMRLFHLGYDVSVVGDMTAPFLTNGDLLILSVGPGYVSTVDALRSSNQTCDLCYKGKSDLRSNLGRPRSRKRRSAADGIWRKKHPELSPPGPAICRSG